MMLKQNLAIRYGKITKTNSLVEFAKQIRKQFNIFVTKDSTAV